MDRDKIKQGAASSFAEAVPNEGVIAFYMEGDEHLKVRIRSCLIGWCLAMVDRSICGNPSAHKDVQPVSALPGRGPRERRQAPKVPGVSRGVENGKNKGESPAGDRFDGILSLAPLIPATLQGEHPRKAPETQLPCRTDTGAFVGSGAVEDDFPVF